MADENSKRFTFDPSEDGAEVPTLTSLLYKKNVVKSDASAQSRARPSGAAPVTTLEATTSIDVSEMAKTQAPLTTNPTLDLPSVSVPSPVASEPLLNLVSELPQEDAPFTSVSLVSGPSQGTAPAAAATTGNVAYLDPQSLAGSKDPTQRGLEVLAKRKLLRGALVLTPEEGGRRFRFTQQVGSLDTQALWDGICLEVPEFQDLFSRLTKLGFIEFSPLATAGALSHERAGFRTALGASNKEFVTLVRMGTPQSIDAIVAVISEGSVQAHLPFFHSAGMQKAA